MGTTTTTTARRRRASPCASRAARPTLGVSAALAAACCSTLLLQTLTTSAAPKAAFPSPTSAAAVASSGLLTALLARVGASSSSDGSSSSSASVDVRAMDLRVANVSVHRVRYVNSEQQSAPLQQQQRSGDSDDDDDGEQTDGIAVDSSSWWNDSRAESLVGRWTRTLRSLRERKRAAHVTSVVVTWDDHFRSSPGLAGDDGEDAAEHEKERAEADNAPHAKRSGVEVTYELQHWVSGWGLDGLWHPSNRVVTVADPFVVLSSLPQEHEIAFRVRMRVKQTSGLLSSGWFATETEGPWSAVTLLSPSRDDALAAILVFLLSNKTFFLLLLLCIGSGILVICKLFVSHRLSVARSSSRALATTALAPTDALDESTSDHSDSPHSAANSPLRKRRHGAAAGGDLLQEITDLRQELADSEAEVRKLMVFRGYGMERLAAPELALVEQELRTTLQRVQKLRRLHAPAASSGITSSEDDTEGDEADEAEFRRQLSGAGGGDRGRGCRRRLGAVPESPASELK